MRKCHFFLIIIIWLFVMNFSLLYLSGEKTTSLSTDNSFMEMNHFKNSNKIKSYVEHTPILIDSNADFVSLGFPGNGTQVSPYIIQNMNITSTGMFNAGIKISLVTAYFMIRDCFITSEYIGIQLKDQIPIGRAKILNNICISSNGDGGGIVLSNANGSNITGNRCTNFISGIHLNDADSNIIDNNTILSNNYQGINLRLSNSNIVTNNVIQDTEQHGIALVVSSSNNKVHHNLLINNSKAETYTIDDERTGTINSQGYDEGTNNIWYDIEEKFGNRWSDYSGSDFYSIDGPANSEDIYPYDLTNTNTGSIPLSIIISLIATANIGLILIKKKKSEN